MSKFENIGNKLDGAREGVIRFDLRREADFRDRTGEHEIAEAFRVGSRDGKSTTGFDKFGASSVGEVAFLGSQLVKEAVRIVGAEFNRQRSLRDH